MDIYQTRIQRLLRDILKSGNKSDKLDFNELATMKYILDINTF